MPAPLRVSSSKGPDPTLQGLLYGSPGPLPSWSSPVLCIAISVASESLGEGAIHVDGEVVTQRKGKVDGSGRASREIKVVKLPCKLQSAIQWKRLLL